MPFEELETITKATVEELNAILARPDEDFILYTRGDGEVRTLMRPKWFPRWIWAIWREVWDTFVGSPFDLKAKRQDEKTPPWWQA